MNQLLQDKVTTIALATRAWVVDQVVLSGCSEKDDLMGWCAIASGELHKRLKKGGINAEIHMWAREACGTRHCFVVVDDHVVDITATQFRQFRNKELVIMHTKEAEVFEMYESSKVFTSAIALQRFQEQECWPSDQIAYA
jgi:hypothetical protein